MAFNWGPHFIVPSETLKTFSGMVLLRETLDEELLKEELAALGLQGDPMRATNPWYCRKRGTEPGSRSGNLPIEEGTSPFPGIRQNLRTVNMKCLG